MESISEKLTEFGRTVADKFGKAVDQIKKSDFSEKTRLGLFPTHGRRGGGGIHQQTGKVSTVPVVTQLDLRVLRLRGQVL